MTKRSFRIRINEALNPELFDELALFDGRIPKLRAQKLLEFASLFVMKTSLGTQAKTKGLRATRTGRGLIRVRVTIDQYEHGHLYRALNELSETGAAKAIVYMASGWVDMKENGTELSGNVRAANEQNTQNQAVMNDLFNALGVQ